MKSQTIELLRSICIYRSDTALNSNVASFCDDFNDYLTDLKFNFMENSGYSW